MGVPPKAVGRRTWWHMPQPGLIQVHRLAPRSSDIWAAWSHTWPQRRLIQKVWRDEDIPRLINLAFPSLSKPILSMRATIERVDMARLAIMYLCVAISRCQPQAAHPSYLPPVILHALAPPASPSRLLHYTHPAHVPTRHGGVYADLDQELMSVHLLRCIVALDRIVLPFEVGRLIGQSIIISPPRRLFWRQLALALVRGYNASCYEPMNTGPDAITRLWNEHGCAPLAGRRRSSVTGLNTHGVLLMDGLLDGPVVKHHMTGSWRDDRSVARKKGALGCAFKPAHLTAPVHVSSPEAFIASRGCRSVVNFTHAFARRLGCRGLT